MTRSPRPSPSIFAYYKWSNTGIGNSLGTRPPMNSRYAIILSVTNLLCLNLLLKDGKGWQEIPHVVSSLSLCVAACIDHEIQWAWIRIDGWQIVAVVDSGCTLPSQAVCFLRFQCFQPGTHLKFTEGIPIEYVNSSIHCCSIARLMQLL